MPKKYRGPAIKKKWTDALRSNQYHQGMSRLKKVEDGQLRHCCLGVLCEVAGIPSMQSGLYSAGEVYQYVFEGVSNNMSSVLPSVFTEKHFVSEHDPERLADMNDSGRYSFDDIADYIEKHVRMRD